MSKATASKSISSLAWHTLAIFGIALLGLALSMEAGGTRSRPLKIIVPFAAGGGSDLFVRMMQKAITDEALLDQPTVIINQEGGSGTIGSRTVMTAAADGFTVLNLHEGIMTAKLAGIVPYGPEAFEPIAATGRASMMVVVPTDSPFLSLNDMLETARRQPETIRFGANIGAPAHFSGILLERALAGAKFRAVQSGGGQQRYTLLIGGHLDMAIFSLDEYMNYRASGMIRALAILDAEPNPTVPEIPTARSQGIDVVHHNTQYWWAPKGTPQERIDALASVLQQAMDVDLVRRQLAQTYTEALFVRGDPLKALIAERLETLGQVSLSRPAELPDFPLIVGCVTLGLLLCVFFRSRRERHGEDVLAPKPQMGLVGSVGALTLLYVLLLQLRLLRFAILTTLFAAVVGTLIATRLPRRPWLAIGEVALLCGMGMEYVFKHVLVLDLP